MSVCQSRFASALLLVVIGGLLLLESGINLDWLPDPAMVATTEVAWHTVQLGQPEGSQIVRPGQSSAIHPDELALASNLSVNVVDWLGPAAPIALSPFFGMTCLSGLAIWGPEWMPASEWLKSSSALTSRYVFWSFFALTLLTSLPRFVKLTKPLVHLAEQAETYSVLVMLFVVRFVASTASPETVVAPGDFAESAGVMQMSGDFLLYIAMIINVIVINSVKICFDLLIWMTPVPAIDAIFELANKGICAALMALYAYSPLMALMLNLAIFIVAAVVFRWVTRMTRFYRTILLDFALGKFRDRSWNPGEQPVHGFISRKWQGMPSRCGVALFRTDQGWAVQKKGLLFGGKETDLPARDYRLEIRPGALTSDIAFVNKKGQETFVIVITSRYSSRIAELALMLGGSVVDHPPASYSPGAAQP